MARRSDHSRAELATLVIAAAREITIKDGWRAATMRRIGAEIGYAAGSIYNAVGDIDAVLLRVNADTLVRLGGDLQAILEDREGRDVVGTAMAIADGYIRFVTANGSLWAALLDRRPAADGDAPEWYARPRARLIEIVASALTPLYPDAKARRRAVIALWAALQGVASLSIGGNLAFAAGELDPTDIVRSIVLRYLTGTETVADIKP